MYICTYTVPVAQLDVDSPELSDLLALLLLLSLRPRAPVGGLAILLLAACVQRVVLR